VPKTTQEKGADPDGKGAPSGFQKGVTKLGFSRHGCTLVQVEKMVWKSDENGQLHVLKPRLWCERYVENRVMWVSAILQKRDAKGGVK